MANNQFYRGHSKFKPKENKNYTRVNFQIKAQSVRVVKEDGTQLGVFQIDAARKLAYDAELDLVEIVPNSNPPVCRLTNYDKFRYDQKQKEKESKKNQKAIMVETKEIRLRPCTQENDIETKANTAIRFLNDGKKVLINLEYKKRELSHKDEGYKIINSLIDRIKEHATIEMAPRMEGSRLVCRVSPNKKTETNLVS